MATMATEKVATICKHSAKGCNLSVQNDDLAKAKRLQTKLMNGLSSAPATDPKPTQSAKKRTFPKSKVFGGVPQPRPK
ncbi:MAG: hypothetical protein ACHRHE_19770 [Tepidisphaerales bacterium]